MMLAAVQATDKQLNASQYLMCISTHSALSLLVKRYSSCMSQHSKHISKRSAFEEDLMQTTQFDVHYGMLSAAM